MNFAPVFNEIIMLFLIIFIGYLIRKKGLINEVISKGLSELLVNLTIPALIIISMQVTIDKTIITNMKIITIITVLIYVLTVLFSNLLVKIISLPVNKKNVFIFMIIFGNVGFMGYPVLGVMYPEYGIFYGLFNNIAFNLLVWTYGVYLFTSTRGQKYKIEWKYLLNNGIIAVFIGFFLLFTGFQLPGVIYGALDKIGNMTFPLSMIIIGSSLANISFREIFSNRYILLLSFIKLLFVPGVIFASLYFFDIPAIVTNVSIILVAMPIAANSVVFAEKFDRDHQFAAQGVFMTTLFSLLTIPLFLILLS